MSDLQKKENTRSTPLRCVQCKCLTCAATTQIHIEVQKLSEIEQPFLYYCKNCDRETMHSRVITRRLLAEQKREQQEKELRQGIQQACEDRGFKCRFLYQSVIITTPIADWAFDYHLSKKTLYHESTVKINFSTGDYAKSHVQFRDKKMSNIAVIEYIAAHDAAKMKESCKTTKE